MQGRLSPMRDGRIQSFPAATWQQEFPTARACGFEVIEWVLDGRDGGGNPLLSPSGRAEIRRLQQEHQVLTPSVCCDSFMEQPLLAADETVGRHARALLEQLVAIAPEVGLRFIELPLIGAGGLKSEDDIKRMAQLLHEHAPAARKAGVGFLLEVDLRPPRAASLMEQTPSDCVGLNYDMGNSAYWGFKAAEEIPLFGSRIGNVHIKDCTMKDYSVPLGMGDVDFDQVFALLRQVNYRGDFILQAARGSDDVQIARTFAEFARPYVARLKA